MANYWAEKGWCIQLVTLHDRSERPFYELHPAVSHQPLGVAGVSPTRVHAIRNNLQRVATLWAAIKRHAPDAVISFGDEMNVLVLLAKMGLTAPAIVSERVDPRVSGIGASWNLL